MRIRPAIATVAGLLAAWAILQAQNPFREWPAIEYGNFPLPSDYKAPHDWIRARLRYPDNVGYLRGMGMELRFPGYWTMDYPRSDRHVLTGVRRLTRIDARSAEQVVTLDGTDDIYNFPVAYGVEVGHWILNEEQAKQLREYLLRGGFLMVDDFHGSQEWDAFEASLKRVFPDRPWEDIPAGHPIFHTLYDVNDRMQVPGAQFLETGRTFERDGVEPHWRGVSDDKGRIVFAICHNMDLGDAWEHSDDPDYPEKYASLAYRVGMNYFVYDLTH
ncbi:MAG: DUF4159 domain-containing protein [Bryobacteraceae bacterium]